MSETAIERKQKGVLRERGQYALVFGIIALMLYVAGFPLFLLFFVGVLTFFIWKVFASEARSETRRIFEFYLLANEMLRDDDRRWYGFEIRDVIARGEAVVASMPAAPPLVHFALGSLYQKLGNHAAAATHLSRVVDAETEIAVDEADRQLRDYVTMLRRIERSPAESPQTSAAIRSLERQRRNRASAMLLDSRQQQEAAAEQVRTGSDSDWVPGLSNGDGDESTQSLPLPVLTSVTSPDLTPTPDKKPRRTAAAKPSPDRQTISEVLHDIYDKNA